MHTFIQCNCNSKQQEEGVLRDMVTGRNALMADDCISPHSIFPHLPSPLPYTQNNTHVMLATLKRSQVQFPASC